MAVFQRPFFLLNYICAFQNKLWLNNNFEQLFILFISLTLVLAVCAVSQVIHVDMDVAYGCLHSARGKVRSWRGVGRTQKQSRDG